MQIIISGKRCRSFVSNMENYSLSLMKIVQTIFCLIYVMKDYHYKNEKSGEGAQIPVTWQIYRTSKNVLGSSDYKKLSISDWHFSDRDKEQYKEQIIKICEVIKEYYDEYHIIYISARQAKEFISKTPDEMQKRIQSFDNHEGKGIEKRRFRDR